MSSRARLTLVLATVLVLAGGFVLASRAAEEEAPSAAPVAANAPAEEAPTAEEAAPAEDEPVATTGTRTEQEAAAPRIPTLVIEGGRPRGEPRELEAAKGERVRFRVRSDVAEELHIHGYDRYVDVAAGRTTTVSFPATIEGIFEVELHGAGVPLGSLRVEP